MAMWEVRSSGVKFVQITGIRHSRRFGDVPVGRVYSKRKRTWSKTSVPVYGPTFNDERAARAEWRRKYSSKGAQS